jgi:hypothetical protein
MEDEPDKQIVLKVYKNEDIKSYLKEIVVFKKLNQMRSNLPENGNPGEEEFMGFPKMISNLQGASQAEILMEALGPNLRKLLKQCPGKVFSKTSIYMITIQLVSQKRPPNLFSFSVDQTTQGAPPERIRAQRFETGQHHHRAQGSPLHLPDRLWPGVQVPGRARYAREEAVYREVFGQLPLCQSQLLQGQQQVQERRHSESAIHNGLPTEQQLSPLVRLPQEI